MSYTYLGQGTPIHHTTLMGDLTHVNFGLPSGLQERDVVVLIYAPLGWSGSLQWHKAANDPSHIDHSLYPKIYPTPCWIGCPARVEWFRWVDAYDTSMQLWAPSSGWISELHGVAVAFREADNRHSIHGLDPNWYGPLETPSVGFGFGGWNDDTEEGVSSFVLSDFLVGHDDCLLMTAAVHNSPEWMGGSDNEPVPSISPGPHGSDSIWGGDASGVWGVRWSWWNYAAGGAPYVGYPVLYDYGSSVYSSEASSWEMCAPTNQVTCEHYVT